MSANSTLYIGASGLKTYAEAMSIVSDNVANANTTGYKANHARFGDMVSGYLSTQSTDAEREGCGSALLGVATNFAQGGFLSTESWSDLAISGKGFFNVKQLSDDGASTLGNTCYTRDGSFHVEDHGVLVNNQGFAVLGSDGNMIKVEADPANPVYSSFAITADGKINGTPLAGGDPVTVGTLRISSFPNQDGLIRQGTNLFLPGSESGTVIDGTANAGINGSILDGNIEGSNVDLATEMVDMIIYQADYNANSKSVTTGNTMLETVINMVR
jgi:flagellar hook protein FlgE